MCEKHRLLGSSQSTDLPMARTQRRRLTGGNTESDPGKEQPAPASGMTLKEVEKLIDKKIAELIPALAQEIAKQIKSMPIPALPHQTDGKVKGDE